MQNLTITTNR